MSWTPTEQQIRTARAFAQELGTGIETWPCAESPDRFAFGSGGGAGIPLLVIDISLAGIPPRAPEVSTFACARYREIQRGALLEDLRKPNATCPACKENDS